MSDIANLSDTIIPKSDQLNSEQLLGGPITVTVTAVRRSDAADQPIILNYENDAGRPYKPCKSMRKVLIFAWGDDGREWIGRSMTLYNDPEVKWGGVKVGWIRISHLSHVERDIILSLTATKGKKETYTIKKLAQVPAPTDWLQPHLDALADAADMAELQTAYTAALTANKARGNTDTRAKIVAVKDTRKQQLTTPAGGGVDPETGEVV